GVRPRDRNRVAMTLRATDSFNQQPLAVWRIGRQWDAPLARSRDFGLRTQIRIEVHENLIADLALRKRWHDSPRFPYGLFELFEADLMLCQIRFKGSFVFHTVTVLAPVFGNAFPLRFSGLSIALGEGRVGNYQDKHEKHDN